MGKAKKVRVSKGDNIPKKVPLADQIEGDGIVKSKQRNKLRYRASDDEEFVDSKVSSKVINLTNKQRKEEEEGEDGESSSHRKFTPKLSLGINEDEEDEMPSDDEQVTGNEFYENIEINEADERALEMFMDRGRAPTRTLADIIMEKLDEKKTEIQTQLSDVGSVQMEEINPVVKSAFEGVKDILSKYRSGPLPKIFKFIPSLKNWEQILYITDPPGWTAAAMYQATRIFASNLKENMAQRFYNLVLLPRIRDDLAEYKRLNFHLYQAVRKALYKPRGFMKGFLLPLLESGDCTLREAIIIGSIIGKNSIPMYESSAALLKIAEMGYTGANSIFIRIFLDKKYALPYRVVDGVVFHFLRMERETRELPVLWHQSLLTFVQRYKSDISSEQKEALLELLKKQYHHTLTAEIRRELQHAKCRDVEGIEPMEA
ncbi:bystin [Microplitis demolitor]|uniref:bystin n=1 Tax=Microplitis demolitor TaxID=69319 RepID=UPI0004CCB18E|nr:bystin [Microplitis demolitor]